MCLLLAITCCRSVDSWVMARPPLRMMPSSSQSRWQSSLSIMHTDSIDNNTLPSQALQESFQRASSSILESDNVYKFLVQLGNEFGSLQTRFEFHGGFNETGDSLEQVLKSQKEHICISPLQRVPGCVATVEIRTILLVDNHHVVLLDGQADAMVSRGLLALLSQVVSGANVTANDIFSLNANSVADWLHLRHVLSPGRNDGLASMVRVVQHQLHELLHPTATFKVKT